MGNSDVGPDTVKTVETAFEILESIQKLDGARISELADDLGLAKSTVHRHVVTLDELGYTVKEGDVHYISLKFLFHSTYAKNRKDVFAKAEPVVNELAERTNERAQFLVEEHGEGVVVQRGMGKHAVHHDPHLGKRVPLHATAGGKAILAHLPEKNVRDILERRGLPAKTEHTITDRDALFEELTAIREREYSFNRQESMKGLHAVAVPVFGSNGRVAGSLSVSGPTKRMQGSWFEEELPELLLGSANELELNIAYA